jgi:hypothetical protein
MRRIGRQLSYANVAATLALVFAMTGGAIAASGGFTANGKLQACVNEEGGIKLLKSGKHCKRGQKTIAWNQTGPAGAKGPAGAGGATGAAGANGANGATGFTSTLPSGKTEVGTFGGDADGEGPYYMPISFNIPIASFPEIVIMGLKAPPTQECPGTVGQPKAAPGHLCIYPGQLLGATLFTFDPAVGAGEQTYGTMLGLKVTTPPAHFFGYGTWAVTG